MLSIARFCSYKLRIPSLLRSSRNPAGIRIPAPCYARRFMLMLSIARFCPYKLRIPSLLRSSRNPAGIRILAPRYARRFMLMPLPRQMCKKPDACVRFLPAWRELIRAGDGNRTRISSLGSWCSATELHLRVKAIYIIPPGMSSAQIVIRR